nr:hypothetical protein [Tanacetum cinerariifolium]
MVFAFEIDLIVFGLETGFAPANFSNRGRGVLQIEDSSIESYSVAEELVTATRGSIVLTCDSASRILPVSWFGEINPSALDNQGRSMPGMDTFISSAKDFSKTKYVFPELKESLVI